jgi:LytR cell envelope-related transcriptional attenuator
MGTYQLSRFFFYQAGMKQPEHSGTTNTTDLESSGSSESIYKNHRWTALHGRIVKGILALLGAALFITIYILANRRDQKGSEENDAVSAVASRSLEVEVLDGAGSMRAAQHMTNILRALGYDVVEMKKNNGEFEERTFIFDRSGNLDAAKKLATILGISQDKVFQKIDRTLYLDLTVVIGKDYSRLKAFQSSPERMNH